MNNKMVAAFMTSTLLLTGLVSCSACQSPPVNSVTQSTLVTTLPDSTPTASAISTSSLATITATQSPAIARSGDLVVQFLTDHNPPVHGVDVFQVFVTDTTGRAIAEAGVSYDLIMTNMNMGKNVVNATWLGDGYYTGKVYLSMPGPWRVTVSINRDGQVTTASFDFMVK
jgi:Tfp pilus assembly protein PilW